MLIYGAMLSPYVRKVCLAAHEKGVAYELRLTSPHGTDPEFRAASPFGKIPALRDGDFTLADSTAIIAWLDAKYPNPPLYPAAPESRGRAVWFEEFSDTILGASGLKVLFNRLVGPKLLKLGGSEAIALEGEAELPAIYAYLESVAPADGWLAGDFSIADHAVASVIQSLTYVNVAPSPAQYPTIAAWLARVHARPAWQAVAAEEPATAPRKREPA